MSAWEILLQLPSPNGGFLCTSREDDIILLGGTNWEEDTKVWLRNVYRFSASSQSWAQLPSLAHPAAYGLIVPRPEPGGTFLVVAAYDDSSHIHNSLFFPEQGKSEYVDIPIKHTASAGGLLGNKLFIVGGTTSISNLRPLTDASSWVDINTLKVHPIIDYPGGPVALAASASLHNEVFIFGGMAWDKRLARHENTACAYAYSPDRGTWRKLTDLPFRARALAATAIDNDKIYIAGGVHEDQNVFSSEAVIYNTNTDSYAPAAALPYAGYVALLRLHEYLYCIGGEDRPRHRSSKFRRISLESLLISK